MPDLDDRRLDALLAGAASAVAYPPTPSMRPRVLAALESGATPRRASLPGLSLPGLAGADWRWRLAAAALAAIAVLVAATLISRDARTAVAEFFGIIEGQRIEFLTPTPTPPAIAVTSASPTATTPAATPFPPAIIDCSRATYAHEACIASGDRPPSEVARPVTLEQAATLLGFDPPLPDGYGGPQALYFQGISQSVILVAIYEDFDLWVRRGSDFIGKGISPETYTGTSVNGEGAYWIEPGGHQTALYDAEGNEVRGTRRTVDSNVLIWNGARSPDGARTYYRLETELSMEEAVAIAETLP